MTFVLIQHRVEDFDKWKPFFDDHGSTRKAKGSKGGYVFQDAEDPNLLTILLEWEDLESARAFAQSEDLKEVMEKAGVVGQQDRYFLKKVDTPSV
jgi:heme-degrading monooxygenase HmoA